MILTSRNGFLFVENPISQSRGDHAKSLSVLIPLKPPPLLRDELSQIWEILEDFGQNPKKFRLQRSVWVFFMHKNV